MLNVCSLKADKQLMEFEHFTYYLSEHEGSSVHNFWRDMIMLHQWIHFVHILYYIVVSEV